jgi:protein-S-isoprenylcysteine O-methyltransferase Ste14
MNNSTTDYHHKKRVLSLLALLGTILALFGLFLPIFFFLSFSEFDGKVFFTAFFILVAVERFWFSLFTSRDRIPLQVSQDWTFVAVGISYTVMMYGNIIEFYLRLHPRMVILSTLGLIFWGISLNLRYWAVKTLGKQWAIHIEVEDKQGRYLIQSGPYRYVRHPIYLAAMLEVVGIPLFFGSFYTVAYSSLVCIPLQVTRTYFEEKNSIAIFGKDYVKYKEHVRAFWPVRRKAATQATQEKIH